MPRYIHTSSPQSLLSLNFTIADFRKYISDSQTFQDKHSGNFI